MSRFRSSLRYRIGLWMLVLGLVPLAVVSLIVLTSLFHTLGGFRDDLRRVEHSLRSDVVGRSLAAAAAETVVLVDEYLLGRILDLRRWSREPALVAAAREGTETTLARELVGLPADLLQRELFLGRMVPLAEETRLAGIFLILAALEETIESPFAELIVTDANGLNVLISREQVDRVDHSAHGWWKAARNHGERGIAVLGPFRDAVTGQPVLGLALPVLDPENRQQVIGVIRGLVRLPDLHQRLSRHAALARADIRLFSHAGDLIADTASSHAAHLVLNDTGRTLLHDDPAAGRALAAEPGTRGAGFVVGGQEGDRLIAGYARTAGTEFYDRPASLSGFEGLQWGATVTQPERLALQVLLPLIEAATDFERLPSLLAGIFAVASALFAGLALLGAVLVSGSITGPVVQVSEAAQRVQQGDLTAHVTVRTPDEVGRLSVAFNQMVDGLRERQRERDVFGRAVSPEVREKLLAGALELGGETRRVTVLFSDIRSFSTISEHLSAQEVVDLLNEYLTEMTEAIGQHGGYLNNFIGDAIVAVFGAPADQPDRERRAVEAAIAMRRRLAALNERRLGRGQAPLASGIGISTGEAVAGQIGSLERLIYTVIGDAVNVAARLESLTKEHPEYPILLNGATVDSIPGAALPWERIGPLPVKGREEAVEVYGIREPS